MSSNIAEIGYDSTRHELRVVFKNGNSHDYLDVSPTQYAGLMSSESHGSYFAKHIRPHHASMKAGGVLPLPDDRSEPQPEPSDPVAALEAAAKRFRGEQ